MSMCWIDDGKCNKDKSECEVRGMRVQNIEMGIVVICSLVLSFSPGGYSCY